MFASIVIDLLIYLKQLEIFKSCKVFEFEFGL